MGKVKELYMEQVTDYHEFCEIWQYFYEGNHLDDESENCPTFDEWADGKYVLPKDWGVLWREHLEYVELKRKIDKDD